MKVKLTPSGVKDIPLPEAGKKIYWCCELIGFGVRAVPSGKSYVVRTRVGGGRQGRDVIYSIGRCNEISLSVARTKAMDALARLRSGTDLIKEKRLKEEQEKAESLTLRELFDEYINKKELRPRTKQTYEDALRLCVPDWYNKTVISITRDMIENRLQTITDEPGVRGNRKAQAMQCFTILRALFRFAEDSYKVDGKPIIQANPTKNIARGKSWSKVQSRDNIIHQDDLVKWWKATEKLEDPVLRDFFQFLLFSGARRSETLQLKWDYIDTRDGVLTIPPEIAKSGKKRLIPLTDALLAILKRRHAKRVVGNDYIFPGAIPLQHLVEPRNAINFVRKEAKVMWSLHDLRRTYATYAASLIPYSALKTLLGHATGSDVTATHYVHLDVKSLKLEAQKVADWLKEKCSTDESTVAQEEFQGKA